MTDLYLFLTGLVVTAMTVTAVVLIGHSEARDPALNRNGKPRE